MTLQSHFNAIMMLLRHHILAENDKISVKIIGLMLSVSTNASLDLIHHVDGLVQERRNSSALAMELRLSCIIPLMSYSQGCMYF